MYTLSAQIEQRNFEETRRRLEQARELVLAFAIVNGRLPCPARSTRDGAPAVATAADRARRRRRLLRRRFRGAGLLPARTIGYQQTDSDGFAVDAWGNRIRYAVTSQRRTTRDTVAVRRLHDAVTPHFTHKDNLRANGIDCQPNDLLVCKSATGITATTCGGAANQIMSQSLVVAIIFSTGKNGAQAPCTACIDEAANLDGNATFRLSRRPRPARRPTANSTTSSPGSRSASSTAS